MRRGSRCRSVVGLGILLAIGFPGFASGESKLDVYAHSILSYLHPDVYAPPTGQTEPVAMVGGRGGLYAGALAAVRSGPIANLSVQVSDLKGPGTIPAGAVQLLFGVQDGVPQKRDMGPFFDSLEDEPPAEVAVSAKSGNAVQLVWLKARVPADAKPGKYEGKIVVLCDGGSAELPLALTVYDYAVPDPRAWHGHLDAVQSPESVALAYDVELWSDRHLELLDRTFAILGEMGQKTLYITAIRRTHFGNEHAMVRWYRDENDELQPDFANVEKYLDVAVRHLGRIPGVILYCWEPLRAEGHAGGTGSASRVTDKPILYTLWNRERNTLRERTGPDWGTPEAKEFWKKFNDGLAPILEKRGLSQSRLYGLIGDDRPTRQAMDDIVHGVENPLWAIHSHFYAVNWGGYPMGMSIALWGIHLNIADPDKARGFGWKSDFWLSYYPREFSMNAPLPDQRYKMEMWMGACSLHELSTKGDSRYAKGLGRIGADFWKVLKDGRGRVRDTLAGRYPESAWGQLNLNYCISSILGQGRNGAVPTVRSEAFREGSQDAEVRVFLEKATEIRKYREKVGEEQANRIRAMLDERIRYVNIWGAPRKDQKSSPVADAKPDAIGSSAKLYAAAENVARTLGVSRLDDGPDRETDE